MEFHENTPIRSLDVYEYFGGVGNKFRDTQVMAACGPRRNKEKESLQEQWKMGWMGHGLLLYKVTFGKLQVCHQLSGRGDFSFNEGLWGITRVRGLF